MGTETAISREYDKRDAVAALRKLSSAVACDPVACDTQRPHSKPLRDALAAATKLLAEEHALVHQMLIAKARNWMSMWYGYDHPPAYQSILLVQELLDALVDATDRLAKLEDADGNAPPEQPSEAEVRLAAENKALSARVRELERYRDRNIALGIDVCRILGPGHDNTDLLQVARDLVAANARVQGLKRELELCATEASKRKP